jgi:hypothetical protein
MENNRIGKGKPGPGRPKGSPNRVQKAAKDAIEEAAHLLGGVDRLVEWAREAPENERAFWATVYPKLLPLTTTVSGSMTINWPLNPASRERG